MTEKTLKVIAENIAAVCTLGIIIGIFLIVGALMVETFQRGEYVLTGMCGLFLLAGIGFIAAKISE